MFLFSPFKINVRTALPLLCSAIVVHLMRVDSPCNTHSCTPTVKYNTSETRNMTEMHEMINQTTRESVDIGIRQRAHGMDHDMGKEQRTGGRVSKKTIGSVEFI